MGSNHDLKQCLRDIVSTQIRTDKRILVFIDEIDAQIESHTAMGLLLGPISDGTFISEGNAYRIDPCIWVFASTKPEGTLRKQTKGRDFISRINGPILNLDYFDNASREELGEKAESDRINYMIQRFLVSNALRTELVYHGVNFLNNMYGPISCIDESVLEIFHNTMPIDGIRSYEIFVSLFHDISYGIVRRENVPEPGEYPELTRHIRVVAPWPQQNKDLIKVIVNPPTELIKRYVPTQRETP
jgi:hypothetical protein